GILTGVLMSLFSIMVMSLLFKLNHEQYVTILPKSITTAIGIAVSAELGGIKTITVATIVMTGILGNVIGEGVCRLFKITDPIGTGRSSRSYEQFVNCHIRVVDGCSGAGLCKLSIKNQKNFLLNKLYGRAYLVSARFVVSTILLSSGGHETLPYNP
ncbi:MAG: LrgB family protein, partial [Sedimentibacter sp.]|nr:LrgB family protein [Sedimentibacter sp.]